MMRVLDQYLVSQVRDGDLEAFGALVALHRPKAYTLAFRFTGNHDDASDAVQDSLIKAYRWIDRYRGEATFGTWLCSITARTCLDLLRKRRQRPWSLLPETDDWVPLGAEQEISPEERVLRDEDRDMVRAALNRLPPNHRTVLILREYMEYTYDDLALAMGCPVPTVKTKLYRARQNLGREVKAPVHAAGRVRVATRHGRGARTLPPA